MIVNKNVKEYIVSDSSSLVDALAKINSNKKKIVYIVDERNYLLGSLSDGDFRRWILSSDKFDLSSSAFSIAHAPCFSMSIESDSKDIENAFNESIQTIPLIDEDGHLVAIAEEKSNFFYIGEKKISAEDPAFIIAEIGNNHQGDIETAKRLVDLAIDTNVDCVKFQMRNVSKLYRNSGLSDDASADLGAQYTLDLLSKFQLSDEELFEVFDYCKSKGIMPLCTPWDLDSLKKLEAYGMPAYKVASADFTNYELLSALALTGKPLICSTGMSNESEIQSTVAFLRKKNAKFVLLHCNSTYPTPFKDVNLNYLTRLASNKDVLVGYSGHERGWSVPVASIALGAKVIEKHFTLDRQQEGNDHKVSLLHHELKMMVEQIRQVEESLGNNAPREITQGELMNREVLAKSLVMNQDLESGEVITSSMIDVKSPGQGLQPNRIGELIGKKATRSLKKGDFLFETDINGGFNKKKNYSFQRPYGIPVRFHDYELLSKDVDLDFVEFHFSYKDLDVEIEKYVKGEQLIGYAVHAPELFENDHLLDLGSKNSEYRALSVKHMSRVIEKTLALKKFFPKTVKPVIVVNAGGWSVDGFISEMEKAERYSLVKDSLSQLDLSKVEIAIQTMPPFPWHFGGQSYHNIFLDPQEIDTFCRETNVKICLDISHTMMACNFYGWDLYDFVSKVGKHCVHFHIVDAKGSDGEGVQIGEGDVNFQKLSERLDASSPNVQFIPEVWQGHKNRGEGFWNALSYLEKWF